jgi:DedD protein
MGLLSLFRKNKQESASDGSEFFTRTEDESNAVRGKGRRSQRKQANQAVDPALPEKKRARRRLVGAIALVLAAVIVLPMVLDSEPKALTEDIAIQIPSKDNPAARPAMARPAVPSDTESKAFVPTSAGLDKDEEVIQPPATSTTPEKNTAPLSPAPATASKSEPHQKPSSKVEDKVAVQSIPAAKSDDSERARAILEGRALAKADSAAASSNAKQGAYLVQVAALASQDKVKELQSKLKNAGIKSHTQKVATANGERIRVRVGPFANKEEADKMRAKIGKLGLNGTLVPA